MPDPISFAFDLPFSEAIAAARARKVVLPEEYYGRIPFEMRSAATTISGLAGLDQIQAVVDSLTRAMQDGVALGEWKREAAQQQWGLPKGRLETIFRTNVQTAYTAGHWRSFEEQRNRRPYLMWSAINDSRVRPSHLAMDGHIAPIDDPIWEVWHPPAGYNCRCAQISLTEQQARARGYGRQAPANIRPDPGFEGGRPGSIRGAIAKAVRTRAPKAAPKAQAALARREAQQQAAGPVGPKVSAALELPGGKGAIAGTLREVARIIDELHGDGALPTIPVVATNAQTYFGQYRHQLIGDNAHDIKVSRKSPHPHLTLAHEIGHFLDHKGWGGRGFSSALEAAAQRWRDVVRASPELEQLRNMAASSSYVHYLLRTHEVWARAYAQWVAVRSGNKEMIRELISIKTSPTQEAYRLSQWDSVTFEPIAKAIDDLFATLGWRQP
jgi:SPP1 gp7 family putative phage head morphogenesis protein